MNHRMHALCAVLVVSAVISACSQKPVRKCSSHYFPVREYGFCEMAPNSARELYDRGLW